MQFTLLGEPLALDLANTLKVAHQPAVDQLTAPGALDEFWRSQADRDRRVVPLDLESTFRLRRLVSTLLAALRSGSQPPTSALDEANSILADAPERIELALSSRAVPGGVVVDRRSTADGAPDGTRAAVIRSVVDLLPLIAEGRLRECAADDCSQLFVATNAKRRWCTPDGCGNRARVARHAARVRTSD